MKTYREWAEYYCANGVAVYPSCANRWEVSDAYPWKQTIEAVQTFNWEDSRWVGGIAGVAHITLVRLALNQKEMRYIFKVITRFLSLLNLYNYPWVIIDNEDNVFILLQCHCKYSGWEGFDSIQIISRGFYELPCDIDKIKSNAKFFFKALPLVSPSIVKYNDVLDTIGHIIEEFGLLLNKEDAP